MLFLFSCAQHPLVRKLNIKKQYLPGQNPISTTARVILKALQNHQLQKKESQIYLSITLFSNKGALLNSVGNRSGFVSSGNPSKHTIKNSSIRDAIKLASPKTRIRDWKKVYQDGFDNGGNKVSFHYFEHVPTGQAWGGKIKAGWSNA